MYVNYKDDESKFVAENLNGFGWHVLKEKVLNKSFSKNINIAVEEWSITDFTYLEAGTGICECNNAHLRHLYELTNDITGERLYPVGSVCIERFGNASLSAKLREVEAIHDLIEATVEGKFISLKRNSLGESLFSRKAINFLQSQGCFREFRGRNNGDTLLELFNKRKLTDTQHKQGVAIIMSDVRPFLETLVENHVKDYRTDKEGRQYVR